MNSCIELSAVKIFDGHMHIIDKRFPLVQNNGFLPDEFTTDVSSGDFVSGITHANRFKETFE